MVPMINPEEKIQRYYDNLWSVGKKFNQKFLDGGFHFGYYEKGVVNYRQAILNMNKYIDGLLGLGDSQAFDVLEAGCGIGATSRYLAKKYPECHFTGISLGREEIELARKIQNQQNLTNIKFLSGNYKNTGFQNNSFDRVFALESIVYAIKKDEVINEISRILRPQGKCVIIDGFFPKNQPSSSFLKNAYMLMLSKRSIPGVISLQEMQSYLKSAGFTDIVIHDLSKNISKHYLFGGFFVSLRGLVSTEVKRLINKAKGKTNEDTDKIIGGAGFLEMLLGVTKNLGYYAVVATKK
jgi:ubiquinone/menaquinone biosynthesis C-methylase UbiE